MKRFLVVLLVFFSIIGYGQDKPYYNAATKNVQFTSAQPVGKLVFLQDSTWLFELVHIVSTSDSVATVIRNHWFKNLATDGSVWKHEVDANGENNWLLPFYLLPTSTIIFNGAVTQSNQWTGAGSKMLTLYLSIKKNDYITIIN